MTMLSESKQQGRLSVLRPPLPAFAGLGGLTRKTFHGAISMMGAAAILAAIWQVSAYFLVDLPGPAATMGTFWRLVSDPLYDNGPNDKGIGLQLWASLVRVFKGFALASAAAIPLGILLGSSPFFRRFFDPVVQVLRPVSPLAWFPIGLVALQSAPDAAIFVVFICSLWPTVINTAFGVASIRRATSRWRGCSSSTARST